MVVDINDAFDYGPTLCRAPRQKKGGKPDLVRTGPSAPKRNTRRVRSREKHKYFDFKPHLSLASITSHHIMTVADLPQLPLVCLRTADSKDTQQVISGKPTIIGTSALGTIGVVHQVQKSSCRPPTGGWRCGTPSTTTLHSTNTHYPSLLFLG